MLALQQPIRFTAIKKKTINTLLTLSVLRRYKNLKRKQQGEAQQTTECLAESFSQRRCTKSWWFWQMSKLNSLSPSDLLTCRWNWAQAELWAASSAPRWQVVVNEWWMGGSAYFCLSIYWMESKWTCHMTKSLCQFTVQIQFKPKTLHLHLLHLHLCLLDRAAVCKPYIRAGLTTVWSVWPCGVCLSSLVLCLLAGWFVRVCFSPLLCWLSIGEKGRT